MLALLSLAACWIEVSTDVAPGVAVGRSLGQGRGGRRLGARCAAGQEGNKRWQQN